MTNTIYPAKTYRTRDGREVRIYAVDGGADQEVHGAIKNGDGWQVYEWHRSGAYYATREKSNFDLIEVKPKHVRWVNVYDSRASAYATRDAAEVWANSDRLACVRIEFEEGEGL